VAVLAPPQQASFTAAADTYVRSGSPDRNHGAGTFMRLQSGGDNRALIRFDQSRLATAAASRQIQSAKLRLVIVDNGDNWGPVGRTVDVHRLLTGWTEGGGTEGDRGGGAGATWNCAVDTQIANQAKDCSGAAAWTMGQPNNPSVHPWRAAPTATRTIGDGHTARSSTT
jgi:hypothetical protein